jgi:hypothetical protein
MWEMQVLLERSPATMPDILGGQKKAPGLWPGAGKADIRRIMTVR